MKKLLLIAALSTMIFGCKKDKMIPDHYQLSSTRQHDENSDIYLYNDKGTITMSVPITSTSKDLLPLKFGGEHIEGTTYITGEATISGDYLLLSYTEYNKVDSSIRLRFYINNAAYKLTK